MGFVATLKLGKFQFFVSQQQKQEADKTKEDKPQNNESNLCF